MGVLKRIGIWFVFHPKERGEWRGCGKIINLQAGKYSLSSSLFKLLFDRSVNHNLFVGKVGEQRICSQISPREAACAFAARK